MSCAAVPDPLSSFTDALGLVGNPVERTHMYTDILHYFLLQCALIPCVSIHVVHFKFNSDHRRNFRVLASMK